MTRVGPTLLVQLVDDDTVVILDESTGAEITTGGDEALRVATAIRRLLAVDPTRRDGSRPCGRCGHPRGEHLGQGCTNGSLPDPGTPSGRMAGPDQCECPGFTEPIP